MATELRRDINITPLVDIVLVLLIVFIVLVPVLPRALDAALPGGAGPPGPLLRLTLAADGSLDLDGTPITLAELPGRLRPTTGKVVLRVHPSLPLHRATGVLDALKAARPEAVPALVATPEKI
ncbi:ExbD/TolR family protein [Geothrix oryzisoli]|uniref:ExbD/TolR family protein n=1 Tax=Geothrix oryzisoli TaxID=2922721 RepID=UPI001FACF95C|nr:biopolymer transporter ExbD [Geothrix oryzisoli]